MTELQRIRVVLAAMRRRTLLRSAVQAAGFGVAGMLLALLVLAASASAVGPASFWPILTALVLAVLGLGALSLGVVRPARTLRGDRAAARLVARLRPELASDLVSAIELGEPPDTDDGTVSVALVRAFQDTVARTVEPLQPAHLISMRPAALSFSTFVLAA